VEFGDGCTANCKQVEDGYLCPRAGKACVYMVVCGDVLSLSAIGCATIDAKLPGDANVVFRLTDSVYLQLPERPERRSHPVG
jgi:hypothetical protein